MDLDKGTKFFLTFVFFFIHRTQSELMASMDKMRINTLSSDGEKGDKNDSTENFKI